MTVVEAELLARYGETAANTARNSRFAVGLTAADHTPVDDVVAVVAVAHVDPPTGRDCTVTVLEPTAVPPAVLRVPVNVVAVPYSAVLPPPIVSAVAEEGAGLVVGVGVGVGIGVGAGVTTTGAVGVPWTEVANGPWPTAFSAATSTA
jgi:hypothetical protein